MDGQKLTSIGKSCLLFSVFITIVKSTSVYNSQYEICCDGVRHIYPTNSANSFTCCGTNLMPNTNSAICCKGVVNSKPDDGIWECCNTEIINTKCSVCVNDNAISIPEEDLSANRTAACSTPSGDLEFYNPNENLCCEGNLATKTDQSMCCGDKVYDFTQSLCCVDKTIVDVEGDPYYMDCCEGTFYNTKSQACCDNTIVEKGNITNGFCCNKEFHDYATTVCCQDTAVEVPNLNNRGCCGNQAWDIFDRREICCDNILYSNDDYPNTNKLCCGDQLYDENTHICCSRQSTTESLQFEFYILSLDDRPHSFQLQCCDEKVYNMTEQVCCDDELKDNVYGSESAFCCGGEIVSNIGSSCCNGQVYDINVETCINDQVHDFKLNEGICYINQTFTMYDILNQRCCSEIIDLTDDDKAFNRYSCCENALNYMNPQF
ncbi:hypothetical protein CHUAL_006843 [Chamberlinius hualienensis]